MIPKKIHYFWFGKNKKPALVERCIESFRKHAPDCEIKEWNEDNFDVTTHPYMKAAYAEKKWAFVSDYARLKVLYDEGGIYLDTDMYLVRDISELFSGGTFFGKEDDIYINAAIFGAVKNDLFVKDILQKYDYLTERVTIPRVVSELYNSKKYKITLFEKKYFYPYNQDTISQFDKNNPPDGSYAVHMWNYSWGHPLIRFIKKIGLHRKIVSLSEKYKIKNALKKILRSE